ncbi:MAG: hypothetical protein SNJ59_04365 [Aggregatilineales bacterium]
MARKKSSAATFESEFEEFLNGADRADDGTVRRVAQKRGDGLRRLGLWLGGCLSTILIGAAAAVVFATLGFAVVIGGRAAGLLGGGGASTERPAAAPEVSPAAASSLTCPEAIGWWMAVMPRYDSAGGAVGVIELLPVDASLLEGLRADRGAAERVPAADCLASARASLLRAFDEVIGVAEARLAGDLATAAARAQTARFTLSSLKVTLWDLGVATEPASPPLMGLPRGGGADCDVAPWFAAFQPIFTGFTARAAALDLNVELPEAVRRAADDFRGLRDSITALEVPGCARYARAAALTVVDRHADALVAAANGDLEAAAAAARDAHKARVALNTWLIWLGAGSV